MQPILMSIRFTFTILLIMFLWNPINIAQVSVKIDSGMTVTTSGGFKIVFDGNWYEDGIFDGTLMTTRTVGTDSSNFGGIGIILGSGPEDVDDATVTRVSGSQASKTLDSKDNLVSIDFNWTLTSDQLPDGEILNRTLTFFWKSRYDKGNLKKAQLFKSDDNGLTWLPVGKPTDLTGLEPRYITTDKASLSMWTVVGRMNNPPSNFDLLMPRDNDTLTTVDSVNFIWRKSIDEDGDAVKYIFHLNGGEADTVISNLQDTTLVFYGKNILQPDTTYNWFVESTDGTDTTSSTKHNQFLIWVNHPPSNFDLLFPPDNAELKMKMIDTVNFIWKKSTDEDGDTVKYIFHLKGGETDTVISNLQDTTLVFYGQDVLRPNTSYEWHVESTDGTNKTPSKPYHFKIILDNIETADQIPVKFSLSQNYPNPFNPTMKIIYSLPKTSRVLLIVYDIFGREIVRLVDGEKHAGYHQVVWDGRNNQGNPVASGIYIYQIIAEVVQGSDRFSTSKKSLLLK